MLIEVGKLFGWVTVYLFIFAILNFFLKYFNKNYAQKVFKSDAKALGTYRKIMAFVVKNHRYFGIGAALIILIHAIIMLLNIGFSITGLIALVLMMIVVVLGAVLQFNKTIDKVKFRKVHRILSFILLVSIIVHLL